MSYIGCRRKAKNADGPGKVGWGLRGNGDEDGATRSDEMDMFPCRNHDKV